LFQEYVGHDWGRKRKWEKQQQEIIANEKYGYEGVLAVDLHHILDILEEFSNPQKRGSKGRTFNLLDQKQIKNEIVRKALEVGIREEVIKFILENFWEIINDIENST
jgi:hypothetical protein